MVMPGISRFLISPCLMVIFWVSLLILRISPSVMSAVGVLTCTVAGFSWACVVTENAAAANNTKGRNCEAFMVNPWCELGDEKWLMLVHGVSITCHDFSAHSHSALHPCVVVTRLQARKIHLPGLGELPDYFTGFSRCDGDLIFIGVFHLGVFFHHLVVLFQFLRSTQDHFMLKFAGVLDHKPDGFTLFDSNVSRCEAHDIGHVHSDGARHLGGIAGLPDGIGVAVMATGMVASGKGSLGNQY